MKSCHTLGLRRHKLIVENIPWKCQISSQLTATAPKVADSKRQQTENARFSRSPRKIWCGLSFESLETSAHRNKSHRNRTHRSPQPNVAVNSISNRSSKNAAHHNHQSITRRPSAQDMNEDPANGLQHANQCFQKAFTCIKITTCDKAPHLAVFYFP